MAVERELVQLFGERSRELDAMRSLAGGVTATHLRTATLTEAAFDALVEGLSDRNSRVRWWCIQVLDHVPDPRALTAIAALLDDPVPRVRRNAAHALGCAACKPDWAGSLPDEVMMKLASLAAEDSNRKVRSTARAALSRPH